MNFFIVSEFTPKNRPIDCCKRILVHLDHEYHDCPVTFDSPCSLIGAYCNRLYDFGERHGPVSCYGRIKANRAAKKLNVTNTV